MGLIPDLFRPDRYKSWARQASDRALVRTPSGNLIKDVSVLATYPADGDTAGLNEKSGPPTSSSTSAHRLPDRDGHGGIPVQHDAPRDPHGLRASPAAADVVDPVRTALPPQPPSAVNTQASGAGDSSIAQNDGAADPAKRGLATRMANGSKRFVIHLKDALLYSWVNILLIFVPIGIAADAAGLHPGLIFGANAVAIIPLAGLLAHATEAVASRLGDTWGALLNISFGNAVELIIFIIALVKNEISIVQAALLGSILANLLLILGMAFLLGGLRFQEQIYNNTVTQMSACLLSLSVVSLLLPTAFHAAFKTADSALAEKQVLKVSRGTSVVLLFVYILYLLFQLKSHAYMYESTPQEVIDEESHPGVFADMMNTSSSDSSSTDSSSDTDTSGSIRNPGKRIKRAFRNHRRRKSMGSTSTMTTGSALPSALHSPSTAGPQGNYWENHASSQASRRESNLAVVAGADEQDADNEGDHAPRIRDFVRQQLPGAETQPSARKKHRSKKDRKADKKGSPREKAIPDGSAILDDEERTESPVSIRNISSPMTPLGEPNTNGQPPFSSARPGFNKLPFGRSSAFRPTLPKMLSQNVFVGQPPPTIALQPLPARSMSSRPGLRRTSSLPDRLKRPGSQAILRPITHRTDPLPPYRHQSTPIEQSAEVSDDDSPPMMSRTAAVMLLLFTTALVAVCAEFMVDVIPSMLDSSSISQAFIGLIILPIVSNAAEHVTAVKVAAKNKMDLAIGVAVGSSIQIALFVTPLVVLLGWILGRDMSLYFNLFDTISLFVTAFVINFLILDGRSNYLEGSLLIAAYVIIALGAFFYPSASEQSAFGGSDTP